MTQAFLIVTLQMLKNRMVSRIRRLKNPRYLLSTLAGLAYFWFMFFRKSGRHGMRGPGVMIGSLPVTEFAVDVASLVILILMIGAWALPEQSGGLEFSEAEIQFLFAAPLSRTKILLYKFMRGLTGIVISATIMTIFGFRSAKGIGLLFLFGTLSAYFIMVALGRARLKQMGIGALARFAIAIAIFVGIAWLATIQFRHADVGGALNGLSGKPAGALSAIDAQFHGPIVNTILFIPRVFATAIFPSDVLHLFIACAGLVVIGFLSFQIAARLNVSFEEASIRYSKRKADRRERQTQRQRGLTVNYRRGKPLFQLGESGRPEVAFIWKNSLSVIRMTGWGLVAIFLPIIGCSLVLSQLKMISTGDRFMICGSVCLILACILALMGPMMLKNDLRLDLPRFEVLKTYPLSGETIVAGEIAAPLALLSALQIIFITLGTILFRFASVPSKLELFTTVQFAIIAIIFVIPICAVQLLIQNAAVVFFPAWANPSKEDVKGFVATGQRMLVLACYLIVLSIILLPPAAIFVPTILFASRFLSGTPIFAALTTLAPVGVLIGEIYLAVKLLGGQFERIDVSEER